MPKLEDVRLGQLLIRKRWCSLRQVNSALAREARLKGPRKSLSLGWILVREGSLDGDRLKVSLSELGILRLICPSCRRERPVSNFDPDESYKCSKCQVSLVVEDELTLDDPTMPTSSASRSGGTTSPPPSVRTLSGSTAGKPNTEDAIVGKVIGGCQVLSQIARGGMGLVYKARQLKLGRSVAVKVLSEELALDRKYVHRFLQEAQSAAELSHGNIVHIIDVGEINGLFYIIMEFVDGSNVRELLDAQRTLEPLRVVEIALQACQALSHAHKRGIVHRDIKPENIMLTREGVVKIADLGLAKKIHPDQQDGGITQTKAVMGTPYYMAPEQVKDFRQVDGRSDIYSLGVSLFRALTGVVPFEGRTAVEVMIKVVEGARPTIQSIRPDISTDLEAIVDKMMAHAPKDRYQAVADVSRDLERVRQALRTNRKTSDSVVTK